VTKIGARELRAIETKYVVNALEAELPPQGIPGFIRRNIWIDGQDPSRVIVTVLDVEEPLTLCAES
jgi:hypothetical protein